MKFQLMTSKRGAVLMLVLGLLLTLTKATRLEPKTIMYLTDDKVKKFPAFKGEVEVLRDTSPEDRLVKVKHTGSGKSFKLARRCLQHFETGSIVYLKNGKDNVSATDPLEVVDGKYGRVRVEHENLGERTFAREDLQHFEKGTIMYLTLRALTDLCVKYKLIGYPVFPLEVVGDDKYGRVLVTNSDGEMLFERKDLLPRKPDYASQMRAKKIEQQLKRYAKENPEASSILNSIEKAKANEWMLRFIVHKTKFVTKSAAESAKPHAPKRRRRLIDRLHTSEKKGRAY